MGECPICLETIQSKQWGVTKECGHPVHKACWKDFIGRPPPGRRDQRSKKCPLCKTPTDFVDASTSNIALDVKAKAKNRKPKKTKDERSDSSSAIQLADQFIPIVIQGHQGSVTCTQIQIKLPNTMVTIMPSNTVEVSSFPAKLVTATVSGGCLSFNLVGDVASATRKGVRIGIPSAMLNSAYLDRAVRAQILNGFTDLRSIRMSGASSLKASLSSAISPIKLQIGGASSLVVDSNVSITAYISGASDVQLNTFILKHVKLSGCSKLKVMGNVNSAHVSRCSTLTADGHVNYSDVSGQSKLHAASIGSVYCSGRSSYKIGKLFVKCI